jgi:DNA-binding CsgD family transcriptional regulator
MAVRVGDLRRGFRILHEAADAPQSDAFSREMLGQLATLFGADLVEYFELRERDRFGLVYTASEDQDSSPDVDEAFLRYGHQNPLGAFKWEPADGAVRLSEVVPARSLKRLELYQECWLPLGIRDQLKIWLTRPGETAVCVSMDRADGSFTGREQGLLEALQPQLAALHQTNSASVKAREDVSLTRREAQVLTWAAAGKHNQEIAEVLFMSPGTVRKHLEHAYAKLGVRSRGEAIAAVMRTGPKTTS